MNPRLLAALVAHDLRVFFADRKAVVLSLLVPIGIASFFGMLFSPRADQKAARPVVLVADQDRSALSKKLRDALAADPALEVRDATAGEAREAVRRGKAPAALLLPTGFARDAGQAVFGGGARPTLTLLTDPSKQSEAQMIRGLTMQQVASIVMADAYAGTFQMPCALIVEPVEEKSGNALPGNANAVHAFIGMAVQGLLFLSIDFAMGLLRDRRLGLLRRLRAAPITGNQLLIGKLLAATLTGLFIQAAVLATGAALFGLRIAGSVAGFFAVALAAALMVAAFGLLVASLGKTEAQSRAAAIPAVLGMSVLGGAWFPAFLFPDWLQNVSRALPSRWAIDGFDAMTWRGLGLIDGLVPAAVLLGFALAFATIARLRFRWE